ncbi:hypothetical protein E4U31_006002 [Claviceps sp. LM219 group G6]|nr:hypothetical protein E4U31_006002 [Claviceps sp. LM219 group G6]
MASDTTGQSIPDDPHRPEGPRLPPPASRVEYRKYLRCFKTKPLQDFKSMRKEGSYVTGCTACREHEKSRKRVNVCTPAVSGTKRTRRTNTVRNIIRSIRMTTTDELRSQRT